MPPGRLFLGRGERRFDQSERFGTQVLDIRFLVVVIVAICRIVRFKGILRTRRLGIVGSNEITE